MHGRGGTAHLPAGTGERRRLYAFVRGVQTSRPIAATDPEADECKPCVGRTVSEWSVHKEADTCTAGEERRTCQPGQENAGGCTFSCAGVQTSRPIAATDPEADECKPCVGRTVSEWSVHKEADTCTAGEERRTCQPGQENAGGCTHSCAGVQTSRPIAATDPEADECKPCVGRTVSEWSVHKEADTCTAGEERRTCQPGQENAGGCTHSCAGVQTSRPIAATDPEADECKPCEARTITYGAWLVTEQPATCQAGSEERDVACVDGAENDGSCTWSCAGVANPERRTLPATAPDSGACQPCVPRTITYSERRRITQAPTICEPGRAERDVTCQDGVENEGGCDWSCAGYPSKLLESLPAIDPTNSGCSCPSGATGISPRSSVVHPNPQSVFDGLQAGLVNTTTGNLTFSRRDMVARAQGPVVFARVYDSRIVANNDFGPGWRLSLAEELHVDGGSATYTDESGAQHTFMSDGTRYVASPSTPQHAATVLSFAKVNGTRIATLVANDTTRTFEEANVAEPRYVLRTVRSADRELVLDYDSGLLASISHDNATLFVIQRNANGRIRQLHDRHGRVVHYTYGNTGRLEAVRDLAGNEWRYLYDNDGRLGGALDPLLRPYLAASYNGLGRVIRAFSGPMHHYAYRQDLTTVAEGTGNEYTLRRNAAGVTVALSSTGGGSWQMTLDDANRVSTLLLPERTISYTYDVGGRVATETVADAVAGTTSRRSHAYDAQGRLTSVADGSRTVTLAYAEGHVHIADGDDVFQYQLDRGGRVTSVQQGTDPMIWVERDSAGDIVSISQGHGTVRFRRDELGRITDASFPDGESARYFYDDLGNRAVAEFSDGSSALYHYDASGSTTGISQRDGTDRHPTAAVSRVDEPIGDEGASVAMAGATDRSARFDVGGEIIVVEYDASATLAKLARVSVSQGWQPGDEGQAQGSLRPVLLGEKTPPFQPDYGTIAFGPDLLPAATDLLETNVSDAASATAMLAASVRLLGSAGDDFNGQASRVFHAPEYRHLAAATVAPSSAAITGVCTICEAVSAYGALQRCPAGVVQNPTLNAATDIDGCSQPLPVDTPFQPVFTPSCNTHDACYNTCSSNKFLCDFAFYRDMQAACLRHAPLALVPCGVEAAAYHKAVELFGYPSYRDAQLRHCECCRVEGR